ncbi:transition state regulator [Bacillus toyonensis]|uniref:Transition state regulator n=1 Tax=Bacillus toyonensis TaxID=155322 RepID=A0A2A8H6N5_9BACI|nr:transition state regulator [Bacillus toyonensis]
MCEASVRFEGEAIILQKYKSYGTYPITGENSSKNIKIADGGPEGAKQLLVDLEQYLKTV